MRYVAWSRRSGSDAFFASASGSRCSRICCCVRCRSVRWLQRVADGRVHVGRRPDRRDQVGRLEPDEPEIRPLGIEDQQPELILRLAHLGLRDDQALAPLRDFRARRHQVERRRLADVDTRLVVPLELLRQIQRPLLDRDRGPRQHQVPVGALRIGRQRQPELLQADVGDPLVTLRRRDLRSHRIDLEIAQQRLRDDRLTATP